MLLWYFFLPPLRPPSSSFPGEKRSAEPGRMQLCNTTTILPRKTLHAKGRKNARRLEKRYFLVEVTSEGREVVVARIIWPFSWRFLRFLNWLYRRLLRRFFSFRPHLHAAILHQALAKLAIRNRQPAFSCQLVENPSVGLARGEHSHNFSMSGLYLDSSNISSFNHFFWHISSLFLELEHYPTNIHFLQHIIA